MSRIGQLNELRALREDLTTLHSRFDALLEVLMALQARIEALEPKRKPKKDAE